ncbi:hypothetical protein ABZZ20_20830 [Streptomyces sp. NPDC006430]|uniref:aromatic-ring hydroxylase C-terminal domain-containing protein n=1 Tax=Streptomyces sp. NPDC006430 TaxID=3154299 RepID=UPI0033A49537
MAELLTSGRGLLLDLTEGSAIRESAAGWADPVDLVTAACPDHPELHAILLRPDRHTAWLRTAGHGHADGLHQALQHWYGPAAPSDAASAATGPGSYFDAENDIEVTKTFPVVWPAGGGYPPYSLQVWNGYHRSFSTIDRDIDDRGRVVGLEDYYYRNDPRLTPAVWKKPYDALPTDPGRLRGYGHLEFSGSSPTTNVAVGTATSFEESWPSSFRAVYWSGKGAPLALPFPAGTAGEQLSRAFAATDDDRVGGALVDREIRASSAVIWTCASKQAYAPQS